MMKGWRIISVEAAVIYKHEQINGVDVGLKLPEVKSDAYFWLFKNKLDYSLDSIELEKAYTRICRKKYSFLKRYNNSYETSEKKSPEPNVMNFTLGSRHFVLVIHPRFERGTT